MSFWTHRISESAVWKAMTDAGQAIDRALSREGGVDAESADGLERLRAVLAFSGRRLASADPALLEPAPLEKIGVSWNAAQVELDAFVSDGAPTRITTANAQADAILRTLATVLAPGAGDELSTIGEAATAYRNTLKSALDELKGTNAALKQSSSETAPALKSLSAQIAGEREKITAALTDYQNQFSQSQNTRATEFSAAQADRQTAYLAANLAMKKAFDEAQTERSNAYVSERGEFQKQFTAAQEARAKSDSDAYTQRQAAFAAIVEEYTQKLTALSSQLTSQLADSDRVAKESLAELKSTQAARAENVLQAMDAHRKDVEKLVGVIGNLGVTSGYQRAANHARVATYVWQSLTVLSLGTLVWFAYVIAFTQHTDSANFLQGLATRVFLSVAIGVFAAYAASQADKATITERKNRKLALELEAVGPYIAPLPEDMRNKFRAELGERSFGVPEAEGKKPTENTMSPATPLDVLQSKELRDLVENAVEKSLKAVLDKVNRTA